MSDAARGFGDGNLAPAGLSRAQANDQAKDQAEPGRAKEHHVGLS